MSSEELNKMSQKIPSQGSPYDTDASSGEIEWKLEDLQKAHWYLNRLIKEVSNGAS